MKLRFRVNQAACLRRGENAPNSIVEIECNPADLEQWERDLLADRLVGGISVCRVQKERLTTELVEAPHASLDALIQACRDNEKQPGGELPPRAWP